jgi:nitronate monooxygenase
MRTVSGASLTAAVSNAGGLGFFGAGYSLSDASVLSDLSRVSSLLSPSLPVAVPNTNPFGLGFILFHALLSEALELTQRHRPAAVWFFAPRDVGQLREWIVAFRKEAAWCRVFVQVGSVAEAREVAEMVDVVVAQGTADAGGHGRMVGGSVISLVPEVRDVIAEMGLEGSVAVVAAGGIVDGRGVAAALCLGAHGVVLGTRLVSCKESTAPEGFRRLVLETNDGGVNTVRWVPPPPGRGKGLMRTGRGFMITSAAPGFGRMDMGAALSLMRAGGMRSVAWKRRRIRGCMLRPWRRRILRG